MVWSWTACRLTVQPTVSRFRRSRLTREYFRGDFLCSLVQTWPETCYPIIQRIFCCWCPNRPVPGLLPALGRVTHLVRLCGGVSGAAASMAARCRLARLFGASCAASPACPPPVSALYRQSQSKPAPAHQRRPAIGRRRVPARHHSRQTTHGLSCTSQSALSLLPVSACPLMRENKF